MDPRTKRSLRILSRHGDTQVTWRPSYKVEVDLATKEFDKLAKLGYALFAVEHQEPSRRRPASSTPKPSKFWQCPLFRGDDQHGVGPSTDPREDSLNPFGFLFRSRRQERQERDRAEARARIRELLDQHAQLQAQLQQTQIATNRLRAHQAGWTVNQMRAGAGLYVDATAFGDTTTTYLVGTTMTPEEARAIRQNAQEEHKRFAQAEKRSAVLLQRYITPDEWLALNWGQGFASKANATSTGSPNTHRCS